jgi:hypothetical protein
MRLRTVAVFVVALAFPAAVIGAHYAALHPVECDVVTIGRRVEVVERKSDADRVIKNACDVAALETLATLRELRERPSTGLALARRDRDNIDLCGGDAATIERAIAAGDVVETSRAVLALYRAWCPDCGAANVEQP